MPNNSENENYAQHSLRDIFYILFRHKWKMIIFFLAVVTSVALGTFLSTEIYRAEAKLMVRIGRESITLDPTVTTGQVMGIGQSREIEINSEMEILKSRELAERVTDTFGPKVILGGSGGHYDPSTLSPAKQKLKTIQDWFKGIKEKPLELLKSLGIGSPPRDLREIAVSKFMNNFNVESQKGTNILFLSYEGPGAKHSQEVLAKLIGFFHEKHDVTHRTLGSYEFFLKQSDQLRSQVVRAEEELQLLKSRTGVASVEEQRRILMNRVGSLQRESEATQTALAISLAKIQELKGKLTGLSPTVVTQETTGTGNFATDQMRTRFYELRLKEQELLSKYTEKSTPVQEVRRQIAEAQTLLAKEEPARTVQVTTGINAAYQELNTEIIKETANQASLEAKAKVLKTQQEAARQELAELNQTEVKMAAIQRELSLLDAKYRKYSENSEQARIDQALSDKKISNISVVQASATLMDPVRPRKALNLALGLFLGIVGGIGLAFLSEFFDHSIKTPRDVEEKLRLPLLGSIPVNRK